MNRWSVLKASIASVPFVKYALGLVGIVSCIALIKSFKIDNYEIPVFSIVKVIILMVLLFTFSSLQQVKSKYLSIGGSILFYLTLLIICAWGILFTTSVFFDFPKKLFEYKETNSQQRPAIVDSLKLKDTSILSIKNDSLNTPSIHESLINKSKEINSKNRFEDTVQLRENGKYNDNKNSITSYNQSGGITAENVTINNYSKIQEPIFRGEIIWDNKPQDTIFESRFILFIESSYPLKNLTVIVTGEHIIEMNAMPALAGAVIKGLCSTRHIIAFINFPNANASQYNISVKTSKQTPLQFSYDYQ